MRSHPSVEAAAAVRIGVIDRRRIVGQRLQAALSHDSRLHVVGIFSDWRAAADHRAEVALWVTSERGGGTLPRLSVEHHDVEAVAGLCDAVFAAASEPETTPVPADAAMQHLSPHEYAVLEAAAGGLTASQTARSLGVSVRSVETARRRAMAKLGAASVSDAVRLAHELRGRGLSLLRDSPTSSSDS